MLGFGYLAREVMANGLGVLLELNHYVFLFLMVGLLLHWRPKSFVQAIAASVTPVGGVLIQYPMYAGIVRDADGVGARRRRCRTSSSRSRTQHTFPVMVGIYSAFLGLFIPSAGGKWLHRGAVHARGGEVSSQVHLGWVVQTYNATEALANLIHPFWMLPLVGILGLKARDIVGYSMLQFVVHVPLVLFLVWILNYTLTYVPPVLAVTRAGRSCREVTPARSPRSSAALALAFVALVAAGFAPTSCARRFDACGAAAAARARARHRRHGVGAALRAADRRSSRAPRAVAPARSACSAPC